MKRPTHLLRLRGGQRGAARLARCAVLRGGGEGRRGGGRRLPDAVALLRWVRAGHGIARFVRVASGREYHHHFGQRQRPLSLLNEPPHPCSSGGQRAEGQSLPLPAAVRADGAARAILLHARGRRGQLPRRGRRLEPRNQQRISRDNNNKRVWLELSPPPSRGEAKAGK